MQSNFRLSQDWQIYTKCLKFEGVDFDFTGTNMRYSCAPKMFTFTQSSDQPFDTVYLSVPLRDVRAFMWSPDDPRARFLYNISKTEMRVVEITFSYKSEAGDLRKWLQPIPESRISVERDPYGLGLLWLNFKYVS